jgi:hypothetical protein
MGIQEPVHQKLLDTAVAYVVDGKATIIDGTTPGLVKPTDDKKQDLLLISASQGPLRTTVTFRKPLKSSDPGFDIDLTKDHSYVVGWAMHRSLDDRNRVHEYRGLWKINFFNNAAKHEKFDLNPQGWLDEKKKCMPCK